MNSSEKINSDLLFNEKEINHHHHHLQKIVNRSLEEMSLVIIVDNVRVWNEVEQHVDV